MTFTSSSLKFKNAQNTLDYKGRGIRSVKTDKVFDFVFCFVQFILKIQLNS
jgi:hypothetical protein